MMQGFWRFILGMLAAAGGGLLVVVFQEPVVKYLNPNQPVVEVAAGHWIPFPPTRGDIAANWRTQGLYPFAVDQMMKGEPMSMAYITIQNPGGRTVNQIRIAIAETPPERVLVMEEGSPIRRLEEPREILIESLDPGERVFIYAWSIYDLTSPYYFNRWRIYSSEGSQPVRFLATEETHLNQPMYAFIDDWLGGIVFLLFVAAFLVVLVMTGLYETYVKRLLRDPARYEREKERYSIDPRKFAPDFSTE